MDRINSYRDLIVWQKAKEASVKIYKITSYFPKEECFGLTSQIRRSAVSVASNIAEGRNRGTKKDFVYFLRIAFGSLAELQTQLIIAEELSFIDKTNYNDIESLLIEISKMLNAMITKLTANS